MPMQNNYAHCLWYKPRASKVCRPCTCLSRCAYQQRLELRYTRWGLLLYLYCVSIWSELSHCMTTFVQRTFWHWKATTYRSFRQRVPAMALTYTACMQLNHFLCADALEVRECNIYRCARKGIQVITVATSYAVMCITTVAKKNWCVLAPFKAEFLIGVLVDVAMVLAKP